MKKIFLTSLFCLFTFSVFCQQKIGHVNSQEIMSNMPDIKIIETKIQKESKKMDEMYADMVKETGAEFRKTAQLFRKEEENIEKIVKEFIK